MGSAPLEGYVVVDLSSGIAGGYCTKVLADGGADVLKVEAPEGDSSRYGANARNRGMSGGFQHNARGKRSIVLDLKKPEARDAILRLSATADAFVSNIRPAALERLGLGYEAVRKANESIVYLGMVGTVLGLIMTVSDLSVDKAQSFESFKAIVTAIYVGSGIALYTNLLACIGYLWLGTNAHLLARQEV